MGQLLRIIIILIGVWLVLQIIKRALGSRRAPPPANQTSIAKMVACAYCGIHVPETEAIHDGKKMYCCEEHRRKAPS